MMPHLPAVSSSTPSTTSRAASYHHHHLLNAAAAPLPSPHQYRRRYRVPRCLRPRPRAASSVRCCAATAPAPQAAVPVAAQAEAPTTRVFVVFDLHTDYPENMEWVRRLPAEVGAGKGQGVDVLVVAGDVAETRDNFARTMEVLRESFATVFYVSGNHDLWLRSEGGRYCAFEYEVPDLVKNKICNCLQKKGRYGCSYISSRMQRGRHLYLRLFEFGRVVSY